MTLPALPRELGDSQRDIHSLFLYLQRIRDSFPTAVSTTVVEASYDDEKAQDAVGTIGGDSATIDYTYNDSTPSLRWDVIPNSSTQRVEVAKNTLLIGTRKQIDFIELATAQLTVSEESFNDRVDVSVSPFTCRLVALGETTIIQDFFSAIVSRYIDIQGSLEIQGDGSLEVL